MGFYLCLTAFSIIRAILLTSSKFPLALALEWSFGRSNLNSGPPDVDAALEGLPDGEAPKHPNFLLLTYFCLPHGRPRLTSFLGTFYFFKLFGLENLWTLILYFAIARYFLNFLSILIIQKIFRKIQILKKSYSQILLILFYFYCGRYL